MFHKKRSALLFLLPGLIGLSLFYFVPFIGGLYFSLTDGSIENQYVGLCNYLDVWRNEVFQLGLKNTMELSLLCAPAIFIFSFALAVMLQNLKEKSLVFRNILLLPYLMPSAALMLIWFILFDYSGIVNHLLFMLGIKQTLWLESEYLRFPVVLLYIWKNIGFSIVIFSAALQAVPTALYEYASLEGANTFQQTVHITLPMILPTAFLVFVLAWVNAFKIFKEVYFIGGAYPNNAVYTLQHFMNNKFAKLDYQDVTTAAYSFAVIVLLLFGVLYMSRAVRTNENQ